MQHNYTDEEIKEAENEAFRRMPVAKGHEWVKAFLDALPARLPPLPKTLPPRPSRPEPKASQQEAIDAAFLDSRHISLWAVADSPYWEKEASDRLALAQVYEQVRPQSAEMVELRAELDYAKKAIKEKADEVIRLKNELADLHGENPEPAPTPTTIQHEPIDDYIYEVMRSSPEQLQAIRQRVREFKAQAQAQAQAQESERQQHVVVNEQPQHEGQPDLSGESEKQDPYARLKAYAKAGARICTHDTEWTNDVDWSWCLRPEHYEVHPDDLHMCPEYAPQAEPAQPWTLENAKAYEDFQAELRETWEAKPWTPTVGQTVRSIPEMALGGQMYWRDLAIQLAKVWWKCHNIGASLQHGDLDKDIAFSIVCERHGGRIFHGDTPENAWHKAEEWLLSPDRENFPAACLTPVTNP